MDDPIAALGALGVGAVLSCTVYALLCLACWAGSVLVERHSNRQAAQRYAEDVAEAEAEAQQWKSRQQWLDVAIDLAYFTAEINWRATEREESEEIDD